MRLENGVLIVDGSLTDENIDEFMASLSQEGIERVEVQNPDISAGIIQALWCSGKKIDVEDEFLSKFFDNVKTQ